MAIRGKGGRFVKQAEIIEKDSIIIESITPKEMKMTNLEKVKGSAVFGEVSDVVIPESRSGGKAVWKEALEGLEVGKGFSVTGGVGFKSVEQAVTKTAKKHFSSSFEGDVAIPARKFKVWEKDGLIWLGRVQ